MAEPIIVPPTPTVKAGEPIDTSAGYDQVKNIFDRVLPEIKTRPTEKSQQPQKPPDTPSQPVTPAPEPAQPEVKPTEKPVEQDVPSFLEQALRGDDGQAAPVAAAPATEEWPEELPEFKNTEEAKARYKNWRKAYDGVKAELKTLREKPALNQAQLHRMEHLEKQNQQMAQVLTTFGVQQSEEFQNTILRPLHIAWNEAAKIVKEAGGSPEDLAKAMSLSGKAQFEALDSLFSEMPESAKIEAHDALRTYRRFEEARRNVLANAPQAMEGIRQRETERQMAELNRQREDMRGMFDRAVNALTEGKVEVFMNTDLPEGQWWNQQREDIIKRSRDLYLDNTDMNRVAVACLLASSADAYRKLWLRSQKKIGQLNKIIKERIGGEPDLTEHGGPGNILPSDQQFREDLKQPFEKVFLREFHKSQAATRR